MSENLYRQDFPFSDYLSICLSKTLKSYIKFNILSYAVFLGILLTIILVVLNKYHSIMFTMPCFICIGSAAVIIVLRLQLMYVKYQCAGTLEHGEMIEFTQLNANGNGQGYKITAFPKFLSVKDESTSTLLGAQNRQECLFLLRTPEITINLSKFAELAIYSTIVISSPILFFFWSFNQGYFWLMLLT